MKLNDVMNIVTNTTLLALSCQVLCVPRSLHTNVEGYANGVITFVCDWLHSGFVDPHHLVSHHIIVHRLQLLYAVTLEWLLPRNNRTIRSSPHAWRIVTMLSSALALFDMHSMNMRKSYLRVMMRAMGRGVQLSLLRNAYDNRHWHAYIQMLRVLMQPMQSNKDNQQGVVYLMWAKFTHSWYVGRTNVVKQKSTGVGSVGP